MIGHLFLWFVSGLFIGMFFDGNFKYYHVLLAYLLALFVFNVGYALGHDPIDEELFLIPLAYSAGVVISLKGRNKFRSE